MTDKLTPQQRAEQKRSAKRKGTPTFSAVRFSDSEQCSAADKKSAIDAVISRFGGTREAALIKAFELLEVRVKGANSIHEKIGDI
ncbi:hypothetical protein [Pseudoalteromonas rhizosphaerae]|uniref:hypothetical protein n=1 Tax=Pseudoalteromonas rhizosphaerae TaxID=2518973 RepID=UPI001230E329|nr:hypothetical protein [Pseudoalteromonas rhizosphaerae]